MSATEVRRPAQGRSATFPSPPRWDAHVVEVPDIRYANTPAGAIAFQWHTKLKHMVDLPLTYVVGILVVDKKAIDALSPEDRKAVSDEIG